MTTLEENISNDLGSNEANIAAEKETSTKAKNTKPFSIEDLSTEQIQLLREKFAKTPQRVLPTQTSHTVDMREIDGKIIIAWKPTYFAKKRDLEKHMDVMKTMIPVLFHKAADFKNILWREEFMEADKVTCDIIKTDISEERKVVGVTYKRDGSGEKTSEETERYVVSHKVTYTVKMPDGEEIKIDSSYIN